MSKEYIASIVIVIGSICKLVGFEIENSVIEALVFGIVGVFIAITRYRKGDITVLGKKV